MKTGGTLNFLKKAGAIFMLVAVFASSCNKYADDFKQLNTKLDALATQVAGVTQLTTDLAAVKTSIASLQTAVAALPTATTLATSLAALDTKINTITTNLSALAAAAATKTDLTAAQTALTNLINTTKTDLTTAINTKVGEVATAVAANQTALLARLTTIDGSLATLTTKANGLAADIATLSAKLTTELAAASAVTNGKIDANTAAQLAQYQQYLLDYAATMTAIGNLSTAVAGNGTAIAANATAIADNKALLDALTANLAALAATTAADDAATKAVVDALTTQLAAANATLAILLQNSNMYNGDVYLTNDTEVAFFMGKLSQMGIINGLVEINPAAITAAQIANLPTITSKMTAIIGPDSYLNVVFKAGSAIDLSKLVSVKGNVTITGSAAGAGADVNISQLNNVQANLSFPGNMVLSYDGPYASASLQKVAGTLTLVNKAVVAGTTPLGTTGINFPNVTVVAAGSNISDGVNAIGTLVYPLATQIILSGGVNLTSLTAAIATQVTLGGAAYAGLMVNAPLATAIDLSKMATSTGAVTITGKNVCALDMSLFNSNVAVTINTIKTVTLPALVTATVNLPNAETVTLAKLDWVTPALMPAVKYLTLGAVTKPVFLNGGPTPAIVTANITGKNPAAYNATTWGGGFGNMGAIMANTCANLTTVVAAGTLSNCEVWNSPLLTSYSTSGVINTFKCINNATIASLGLTHTHFIGADGSELNITANPVLTAVKSSTTYARWIEIRNNILLTSLDLSSYNTKLLAAPGAMTTVIINSNKLSAAYTNAVAITPTTPYVETTITSPDILTFKAYLLSHSGPLPVLNFAINLDLVKIGSGAATTLAAKMVADAAKLPAFAAPVNGITTLAEVALVQ